MDLPISFVTNVLKERTTIETDLVGGDAHIVPYDIT